MPPTYLPSRTAAGATNPPTSRSSARPWPALAESRPTDSAGPVGTTPQPSSGGRMEPTTATFFDLVRDDLPDVEARMLRGPDGTQPRLESAIEHLLESGGEGLGRGH